MKRLFAILSVLPLLLPTAGPAVSLRMEGDRLTLRADHEPIRDVMAAFARQGVRVRFDPAVTGTVTVAAVRQETEPVLRRLLKEADYVALWKTVPGLRGPIPVLEELTVFRPGRREQARPLEPTVATSAPAGRVRLREFMAGELLLRPAPGVTAAALRELVAQYGGRLDGPVDGLDLVKAIFPPDTDIPRLAEQWTSAGRVAVAEPNYVYRLAPAPAGSSGWPVWSLPSPTGSPTPGAPLVAVLDTGFGRPDDPLIAWLDTAGGSGEPVDLHGHGTQMTLLAAGRVRPLAVGAPLQAPLSVLSIRIAGQGDFVAGDTLLQSLQAAVAQNVRVISLSWGSDMDSRYMKELLDEAVRKGVVVVAAAGNQATGHPVYPAAFPGVLAVAAADATGRPADWSNYGAFVDLSAPGYAPIGPDRLAAGTSVSTAYTAHILGLYFQKHPDATPTQAIDALKRAVTDSGTDWDARYGAGLLDDAAVLRLLL